MVIRLELDHDVLSFDRDVLIVSNELDRVVVNVSNEFDRVVA
jgi:hypothetical protein